MSLPKLLAAQLDSKLGKIMHNTGKNLMRAQIDIVHKHYEPVLKYKRETGWIKDHVAAEQEAWNWIEQLYDIPINSKVGGWHGDPNGRNRKMFHNILDIVFTIQDEDSAYDIPMLLWLKWIHEHWDRFERSAEQAYQIMNFANLYKDLLELATPLPQDDGKDYQDPDYIKLDKGLKKSGEKNGI